MFSGIASALRGETNAADKNLKIFGLMVVIYEVAIIIFYFLFVRYLPFTLPDQLTTLRWVAFQDIEVMLVVGFGCLMAFVKNYSISVLVYTLFMNALLIQVYPLFNNFIVRLLCDEWSSDIILGNVNVTTLALLDCCGCVAAQLIAYCAVLGRVGPKDLMIMSNFCMIGYCINETIVTRKIEAEDAAGSLFIHAYGAVFGLTTSWVLGRKRQPEKVVKSTQNTLTFAAIGTLLLWVYWPSFNFGASAKN